MRGYREALEVATDEHEAPRTFVWRGRRYRVTQVLETWREHLPWWRLALPSEARREAEGGGLAEGDSDETCRPGARLEYETEQRIWRVEAAAGRLATTGVFEMAHSGSGWRLRRLSD